MTQDTPMASISAHLEALDWLVRSAAHNTTAAADLIRRGQRPAAIVAIHNLDGILRDAIDLQRATLALHRRLP